MAQQYDGSIRIDTKINQAGFNKGIAGIQGSVNRLGASLKSLAATVGVVFGVAKIVQFGKEAISLASDLNEVQNVVETAFGSMSTQVDAWAKNSIKQFGMSELAAKQMASTYMSMSVGSGLQGQGAADMAMKAAERAADISSFYNKSLEESDTMLKSIWTGETESLKQIGVVMTQTNLDAFALANGFGKTTSQMTQGEQIMLRYQYVMNQTRLAAGDFVKTQDSWANQTKVLSEQWKQFLSIMGGALIQVLTPALQFLNQFLSVLIGWAQTFAAVISALFGKQVTAAAGSAQTAMAGAASSAGSLADSTAGAAAAQDDLASSTAAANKELQKQTASFDEMNILQSPSAASGDSVGGGGNAGGAGLGTGALALPAIDAGDYDAAAQNITKKFLDAWKAISTGFVEWFVNPIKDNLSKFSEPVNNFKLLFQDIGAKFMEWASPVSAWFQVDFKENVSSAISLVSSNIANFLLVLSVVSTTIWETLKPVIDWIVYEGLPMVSEMFDESCRTIQFFGDTVTQVVLTIWHDVFDPAFTFISKVITDTFGIIKDLWDKYGATTFENIRQVIETTWGLFKDAWESIIKPIFDVIFEVITQLWNDHLRPLVSQIGEFVAKLVNGAMEIYNKFIGPIVGWFVRTLGPAVSTVINNVVRTVGALVGNISDVVKGIMRYLGGVIDFITGVFTGNWEKAWQGIIDIFGGLWEGLKSLVKIPLNGVIALLNGAISAINGLISGINGIGFDMPDWLGGGSFRPNIPKIPSIPYLAQGAVIPPNQEMLAILGDQKKGYNLEGPESMFRQIVREESGNSGISGPVTFVLKVGETTLGRATLKSLQDIARQNGGLTLDLR